MLNNTPTTTAHMKCKGGQTYETLNVLNMATKSAYSLSVHAACFEKENYIIPVISDFFRNCDLQNLDN